ncbi:MAG TPA: PspA/IM30 family protein [Gammaproteobacteria bacterium]
MKESLTGRVGRIISGSANALVSAVENAAPEMVLEETIREIDGAIDEVRTELGRQVAAKHLANTRLMEENRKHDELAEQITTAVEQGRDDLAEAGIARQLDIEAQIPVLERAIIEAGEKERELEGYVQALLGKKREMREELKRLVAVRAEQDAVAAGGGKAGASVASRVSKAEAAFDRIMERQTGLPGAGSTPDAQSAAKLVELEELTRNNRIKERLAALKGDSGKA